MPDALDERPDDVEAIDRSLDSWCRLTARVERVGPFELYVEPAPFSAKYARPRRGAEVSRADVDAVLARQRSLGVPAEIEYVERDEGVLCARLGSYGWNVVRAPLLTCGGTVDAPPLDAGTVLRFFDAEDPMIDMAALIGHVAFANPGMAVGAEGVPELQALADSQVSVDGVVERVRQGHMVLAAACFDGIPVASASLLLDVATSTAEVAGVGTLPAFRRRGLGLAVTALLVAEARERGITRVWLSAIDENVASLYARVGFSRVGTYVLAALPDGP